MKTMTALRALALLATLFIAALAGLSGPVKAAPGNDGNHCHGANMETCRPDPQPSNGQDCDSHGANTDGNDDHCGGVTSETPQPSAQPSASASSAPTSAPSSAPSLSPTSGPSSTPGAPPSAAPSAEPSSAPSTTPSPAPSVALPATDAETSPHDPTGFITLFFLVWVGGTVIFYLLRRGGR